LRKNVEFKRLNWGDTQHLDQRVTHQCWVGGVSGGGKLLEMQESLIVRQWKLRTYGIIRAILGSRSKIDSRERDCWNKKKGAGLGGQQYGNTQLAKVLLVYQWAHRVKHRRKPTMIRKAKGGGQERGALREERQL